MTREDNSKNVDLIFLIFSIFSNFQFSKLASMALFISCDRIDQKTKQKKLKTALLNRSLRPRIRKKTKIVVLRRKSPTVSERLKSRHRKLTQSQLMQRHQQRRQQQQQQPVYRWQQAQAWVEKKSIQKLRLRKAKATTSPRLKTKFRKKLKQRTRRWSP